MKLKLLTPEQILAETEAFATGGVSAQAVEYISRLPHNMGAVAAFEKYLTEQDLWHEVEDLVFTFQPFQHAHDALVAGGMKPMVGIEVVTGGFTILADQTPLMAIDLANFTPAMYRHELIHFEQFKRGDSTRVGNKFMWKGVEKISLPDQVRTIPEQCKLEWELEAYGFMYSDDELRDEFRSAELAKAEGTHQEQVDSITELYYHAILPSGRKLPFEVKL